MNEVGIVYLAGCTLMLLLIFPSVVRGKTDAYEAFLDVVLWPLGILLKLFVILCRIGG